MVPDEHYLEFQTISIHRPEAPRPCRPCLAVLVFSEYCAVMAENPKGRASFSVDSDTLSVEQKKYFITRNLEVRI